jgi:predicted butyrate kinase (DUF1464 family)
MIDAPLGAGAIALDVVVVGSGDINVVVVSDSAIDVVVDVVVSGSRVVVEVEVEVEVVSSTDVVVEVVASPEGGGLPALTAVGTVQRASAATIKPACTPNVVRRAE